MLRDLYVRDGYRNVILPMTVLRRLHAVNTLTGIITTQQEGRR